MAYCRWSCLGGFCDLYCYEDVSGGYTTLVAGLKRVVPEGVTLPPEPQLDELALAGGEDKAAAEDWTRRYHAYWQAANELPLVEIGLPFDEQRFNDPDLDSFRQRVVDLLAAGYRAPGYLLEGIDEEIASEKGERE